MLCVSLGKDVDDSSRNLIPCDSLCYSLVASAQYKYNCIIYFL